MEAGVYLISNSVNGKCYVGSTIHLDQRRKEHFSRLANNKHAKHIKEGQTGKSLTEEHKQKLSKAAKHRKSPSNHAIINIDGIIYNSLKEASKKTGVKYNTIQKRLKNPNFPNYYYVKFGAIPPKELSYNHDN